MSNSNLNMEPNINNLSQTMLWKNGCIIQMIKELYATETSKEVVLLLNVRWDGWDIFPSEWAWQTITI